MYFVYILKSLIDGSYYTGATENIKKRFKEHNNGKSYHTSKKKPYKLVWFCIFPNKKIAIEFEKYLKSGSGNAFFRKHLI